MNSLTQTQRGASGRHERPAASSCRRLPGAGNGIAPDWRHWNQARRPLPPFSDLVTDAVGQVDRLKTRPMRRSTGLMTGSGVDVHQAMIATQKASMAFELALAVRNKAVQAYQPVIGMQF